MRITFVHEGLFPGTSRAARHVEAMARRFAAKGHRVSVVTTSLPDEKVPDEILAVRLPHAPETTADKDEHLLQKTIVRHLRAASVDVLFAESLTPLSTAAVKAAGECRVPTIVRVLADRDGIMHAFGGRRSNPKAVRKKITALLEHATVAAVSSERCGALLRELWDGPFEVIEKCVDLNRFRVGRTTRRDMEAFLSRWDATGRRILLYARDRLRQSTPSEILPLIGALRSAVPDVLFLLVGETEGSGFLEAAAELGVTDAVRATGPLELRDFFAAYEAAEIFLVPPQSRASGREILEAMAMGCAVACFEVTAATAPQAVIDGVTGVILPGRFEEAASLLGDLLRDGPRLKKLQEEALAVARRHDLLIAIEKVESLAERILGREVGPEEPARTAAWTDDDPGAQEQRERVGVRAAMAAPEPAPPTAAARVETPAAREVAMDDTDTSPRDATPELPGPSGPDAPRTPPPEPPAREPAPAPAAGGEALVWSEADIEGETLRFDPDSDTGFERLEVVEGDREGGAPGPEAPKRDRERDRDRDRDRGRPRDRDRERGRSDDRGRGDDRRRRGGRGGPDVQELGASSGIDVLDLPRERGRRRPGSIEPGLTLKDLLPFLRPPKTVLLLGATTGNGHNRTAAALAEAFRGLDRNLIIREADVLDLLEKSHRATFVRTLLEDLYRNPAVFGTPFETVDPAADPPLPAELEELVAKGFGERFDQTVVDKRPDHIVCAHWLPFRHLEALKDAQKLTATVTAIIPEPDFHARWLSPVVSHYIVATEGVRARLQKLGIDPAAVTVTGTPVSPSFAEPVDREAVLRELGLRSQAPTILFRPGGIGSTERILAAATAVMEAAAPVNLLIVAGKNERLKDEAASLPPAKGSAVRSFGFVDNIRDLIGVADLLITRANPHTVAEACAAGVPMILLRPSPGVEERIADRLLRRGLAFKAYGEEDLEFLVRELLQNRRELQDLQEAARAQRRTDAAAMAVDRIARLVK